MTNTNTQTLTLIEDELGLLASLVPLPGARLIELGCGAARMAARLRLRAGVPGHLRDERLRRAPRGESGAPPARGASQEALRPLHPRPRGEALRLALTRGKKSVEFAAPRHPQKRSLKILILGAGQVGASVAESLVSEKNDVTVVDTDAERLKDLQNQFDLRTVVGNAAHPEVLAEAGAADTDMLFAVTASDVSRQ